MAIAAPRPSSNQMLASKVSQILRQPGLLEIAFQLGGVQVTGSQFLQVAQAVDSGRIRCWTVTEFKSQGKDELVAGRRVEARYEIARNAMLFLRPDYGNTPSEEQTIVHESVHAAHDLSAASGGSKRILRVEDEAAAILAAAFYIKLCRREVGGFRLGGGGESEALDLAEQALLYPGNFTVKSGRYFFTPEETEPLRYAVSVSRKLNKYIGSDGLPTDDSKAMYIYDGVPVCTMKPCK